MHRWLWHEVNFVLLRAHRCFSSLWRLQTFCYILFKFLSFVFLSVHVHVFVIVVIVSAKITASPFASIVGVLSSVSLRSLQSLSASLQCHCTKHCNKEAGIVRKDRKSSFNSTWLKEKPQEQKFYIDWNYIDRVRYIMKTMSNEGSCGLCWYQI